MALSLSIAGPGPVFAAEVAASGSPASVSARPVPGGVVLGASRDEAFKKLGAMLRQRPLPQAGVLRAQAQAVREADTRPGVGDWLKTHVEAPLDGLDDAAVPDVAALAKALDGLDELKSLLAAAPKAQNRPTGKVEADARGIARSLTPTAVAGDASTVVVPITSPGSIQGIPAPRPSAPLTPDEQGKLGQRTDISEPPSDADQLEALQKLYQRYQDILSGPGTVAPGVAEKREMESANLDALRRLFDEVKQPAPSEDANHPLAGTPEEKEIEEEVAKIEALKGSVQAQITARDALAGLLAVKDKTRDLALQQRRNGQDMLEFRKNFARLAAVMDMSLALNEINAAEKAIQGMQALLNQRMQSIQNSQQQNQQNLNTANQMAAQLGSWLDAAKQAIASDKSQQQTMVNNEAEASSAVKEFTQFQQDVSALIANINASDKGASADAATEYQRRLSLLPQVVQWRTSGNPKNPNAFSLKGFQDLQTQVNGYIASAQKGLEQMGAVPLEFAALLIPLVPGPSVSLNSPNKQQILQILADRKTYWNSQMTGIQSDLTSVNHMLDPDYSGSSANEFGDVAADSLPRYRAQEVALEQKVSAQAQNYFAQIDKLASDVNTALGAGLPPLSGLSLDQLQSALTPYANKLQTIAVPNIDSPAVHNATLEILAIADLLVNGAHDVILWAQADGTIKSIDSAMANTLPQTQAKLNEMAVMLKAVLDDDDADVAFINGTSGETNQQLVARKTDLLQSKLLPPLRDAQALLSNVLIPYQQGSIAAVQPNSGTMYNLFSNQLNLINQTVNLYKNVVPWAIATKGGTYGNQADSHAHIASWRATLQQNLNGYKDSSGNQVEGLLQYQTDIKNRQDPNYTGTETVYGELQPYSLPKKISQYAAERAQRASQINADDAQINQILAQIQTLSKGKYNLSAYNLPTGITADAAGVAKVNAVVNANTLTSLASQLTAIGNAAQAAGGGGISIGAGGSSGSVPVGNQPPITVSDEQKIALLALDAARRLAPSSFQQQNPSADAATYAIARFIYSDAVVSAAQDALTNQIPPAQKFVADGVKAIGDAVNDTLTDDGYVNASGASEPAEHVYSRKIAIYSELDGFLREAISFFGLKTSWDQGGINTVNQMGTYYSSMQTIYQGGASANQGEVTADQTMMNSLQQTLNSLEQSKQNLNSWLAQLNDPHESALRRVMENIDTIQDKTRAVLEANIDFQKISEQYADSQKALQSALNALSGEQAVLSKKLEVVGDLRQLSPDLAKRIQAVSGTGSSWLAAGQGGPQTLIIPKSQLSNFLNMLFGALSPDSAARDIAGIKDEILKNPMAITQLLPNTKMVEVGQGSDGFYLVYQTDFSSPGGLETSSQLTFGNVLKLWGNNISLTGYKFESPPSDANAPFGDQGISATVESLQGKNFVNYLDVTFHKFLQDVPNQPTLGSQVGEARMMVFDDFALMLANGKLYFGAAGFADFATTDAMNKPYYYGGNVKASIKFTEIMSLNASEQALFVKDPRTFLQNVNLDFTGYNPDLNQDFPIQASGDNKWYRQDKVGVGFDLQKALQGKSTFKVDFYVSHISGTDDINQSALGTTIVKGFSFDVAGTSVTTTVSGTGELGTQYNTLGGKVAFELPKYGVVLSGEGKLMGDAETYYLQLRKKLGANTDAFISYGSQYVGLANRLTIGMQSTFTLGQLWQLVAGAAADDLQGGQTLKKFNQSLDDFFKKSDANGKLIAELKKVYDSDVGKKLISLEIGQMTKDLEELIKAGAILDNTRMRGMIGFVTNPVATDPASMATGGGFQAGSMTEMSMTKSQKELIHNKILSIFKEGLALQARLLELTKAWQSAMTDLVSSRWDMSLAAWMYANADDPVIKADAQTRALAAADRHRQALLRYNSLTGRGPDDTAILDELSPGDVDGFCDILRKALARPDRVAAIIGSMRSQMDVPKPGFNLMDWIPIFEKITFSLGIQLQDMLSSQALSAGVTLRIPIYDPGSKYADKALRLEDKALIEEMAALLGDFRLKARQERDQARSWDGQFNQLQQQSQSVRDALADGIRQWRNGLISQGEMWGRFRRWYWLVSTQLSARAQAALADAWSVLDGASVEGAAAQPKGPAPANLAQGFDAAQQNSPTWDALAQRSQAAQQLMEQSSSRFQHVSADITIGTNLTATGIALLPAFGITGLGLFPIFNVSLQPEELKDLSMDRHGGEAQMYTRLHDKVGGDIALQLFQGYSAYRTSQQSLEVYQNQIIPDLEKAQDGSSQKAMELDQARLQEKVLAGGVQRAQSQINYLLGRPLTSAITLTEDMDTALSELRAKMSQTDPLAAGRDVLASRVKVAQSVETIVDKNLQLQNIRVEPISLIGRSLGRLISALSGEGMASPELVALAREQTLTAQRDLRAFDAQVPVLRARWAAALSADERELSDLAGKTDGVSRLRVIELNAEICNLKAMMAAYGGQDAKAPAPEQMPSSFAELRDRLRSAMEGEATPPDVGAAGASVPQEAPFDSQGILRYYDVRETLAGTPVGKQYIEGWIEVRLRSAATPPEALIALAKLQQEKADQLYRTEQAQAQARADVLLARLTLEAALVRDSGATASAEAKAELSRDFTEVAAHLHLPSSVTLEQFLKVLPAQAGGVDDAVDQYIRDAAGADLELLKRQLFQEGLPEEVAGARDPLSQMQANVIAERMSYKGFTPVAAFGMFQGRWVGGVFLEAPDPGKIQKTLEGILADALRRELESQDRLKSLSLMLHSLMASVADKVKLLEAERSRVEITRRNLAGAVERARAHMGPDSDVMAAQAEAAAAHEQFIDTVYALRMDFIRLVTELEALGYTGQATLGGGMTYLGAPEAPSSEKTPRQELLSYWAQRLLDQDFERNQDSLLSGVPPALREQLQKSLQEYRLARDNADAVMGKDYSADEKFALLTKVDADGRRLKVEATLNLILKEIEAQGPHGEANWTALMGYLRSDVESRQASAESDVRRQGETLSALRDSFWHAVPAPPAVEQAYARLSRLKDAVYEARQDALHHYLQQKLKPEDYVLKDKALEAYVKALIAYDNEVLKTFSMEEVARDPRWSSALNALFGLGPSINRRRDMLKYGRGILTVDAAMTLGQARLDALRASPEARDEIEPAAEAMSFLRSLRERWIAKPETMPALYEVRGGRDTQWLTSKDLELLKNDGQVVEVGGKRYLLPPENKALHPKTEEEVRRAGGQEIVAGVDAQKDELAQLRAQASRQSARKEIDNALKKSEVALSFETGGKAGRLSQTLTLAELRDLERQGKVLYFNADPDPRQRLRLSVHPLSARWRSPDELVIMVQVSGEAIPAGSFPSLEALEASSYIGLFRRAEFGKKGVESLISEADRDALKTRQTGWLNLKLQSFAYALDKNGEVAAVYMSEDELKKAQDNAKDKKSAQAQWSFHQTAALRLGLDADGRVCSVSDGTFNLKLGGAAASWLEGTVWALEIDETGKVVRVFLTQQQLEAESGSWWLEDMEGKVWKQTDKDIPPLARLKRYIDPTTGLPVLLGRPVLAQHLAQAEKGLGANDRWSYMPWNWGNIILETPRGIIKTPIEMITGRDPNQDGYIGNVYMRQTDGGATEHRGLLGKVVHAIDIFEILPDHVDRYYDPSQFPSRVNNDSPIKPGEWEHQKDPVTTDGKKNVVLGHGSLLREIGWAKEDIEDARGQILGSFTGSVRRSFVEQVRGRAGEYVETKVDHQTGRLAVEATLGQIGDATSPDGNGSLSAAPDHIAVDAVQVSVQVGLGAVQQDQRKKLYQDYLKKIDSRKPPTQEPDYDKLISQAELALAQSEEARLALRAAADAATPKAGLPGFPVIPRLYMAAVGR